MKNVIPCSICKKNYQRHINELPIDNALLSRKNLVYWLIDMHNMVNGEIGKKILTYNEVIKKYETVYGKKIILENDNNNTITKENKNKIECENCCDENIDDSGKKMMSYILIIIIILLIINLMYMIYNKNYKL